MLETAEARFERLFGGQINESDLKGRTVRGGAFAMGAEGIEFVLRLGSIVLLARMLLPENFGLIAMVTAITAIAERFKDLGLSTATVQRSVITHAQVSSLFWVNTGVGTLLMLAIMGLAYPIARFYDEPRLTLVTMTIGTGFLWSGLAVQHQALLRRRMQFPRIAAIQVVSSTLSVVLAVVLAAKGFGYWALVAREVSKGLFSAAGTWLCVPWLPGAPVRRIGVRSMLAFGGHITGFNFANFLAQNLDQILIGKLFGPVPLGLYRQGVNLVLGPIAQLSYPVNSVAEAALSRLQADPVTYRRYYLRILSTLALLTMPLVAFLCVMADDIVLVVLGPQWIPATDYFRIFAIAVFVRPVMSTPGFVMVTQGRSRRYLWWGVISTLVLVACILVGSQWGPTGVAYAQVASTYLLLFPVLHWGFKGTPIGLRDFASAIWRPLVASLLMGAAMYALEYAFLSELHPGAMLLIALFEAIPFFLIAFILLPGGREELAHATQGIRALLERRAPTVRRPDHRPSAVAPSRAAVDAVSAQRRANAPRVSIVINNYNYGRFVGAAIESALRQDYDNLEVIVVDDGSTDDSRAVIGRFGDRITMIPKENGGQASAFNVGIARAEGEFILLLDSDDFLYPSAVSQCVDSFPAGFSRIYYRLDAVDAMGRRLPHFDRKIPFVEFQGDAHAAAAAGHRFPATVTSANFFRAGALKAIVPIPEVEWRICADNFVAIESAALGPVCSVERVLGAYRFHGSNAWMAQDCLYTDRRKLPVYLNSYFQGQELIAENCRRLGIEYRESPLGDNFWQLHLFTAACRMNVTPSAGRVPTRAALFRASLRHLAFGIGPMHKRIVNAWYLIVTLSAPKAIAAYLIRTYNSISERRASHASV